MTTSMTARRLITNSLRTLNVLATGETPSADEAEDSLEVLNEMIESWRLEDLMLYYYPRVVQSTVAGQGVYTVGPGGDWNVDRPTRVESTFYRQVFPGTELELPIRQMTAQEFRYIPIKIIESTIPTWCYWSYDFPLATVQFWPIPNIAQEIVFYPWATLQTAADLDTVLAFPDGYARALRFNLAVELSGEFPSVLKPEEWLRINSIAIEAKHNIKRANDKPEVLVMDAVLLKPRAYDWRSDEKR